MRYPLNIILHQAPNQELDKQECDNGGYNILIRSAAAVVIWGRADDINRTTLQRPAGLTEFWCPYLHLWKRTAWPYLYKEWATTSVIAYSSKILYFFCPLSRV